MLDEISMSNEEIFMLLEVDAYLAGYAMPPSASSSPSSSPHLDSGIASDALLEDAELFLRQFGEHEEVI